MNPKPHHPAPPLIRLVSKARRALRILVPGTFAIMAGALFAQPYPSPSPGPEVRKILFFDDADVLYRSGTKRLLHPLQKIHPRSDGLINAGKDYSTPQGVEKGRAYWESQIAWVSVYRRPDHVTAGTGIGQLPPGPRYQMWYQGHTAKKTTDRRKKSNVCYAHSEDGIHWVRPGLSPAATQGLGLHDFVFNVHGDTLEPVPPPDATDYTVSKPFVKGAPDNYLYFHADQTNIVMIGSGGHGERFANSVLVEPHDPDPARRYKMIFYDWANTTSGASLDDPSTFPNNVVPNPVPDPDHIGAGAQIAFSPDGIHWTKFSAPDHLGHPGPAVLSRTAFGGAGQPPTTAQHAANPLDFVDLSTEEKLNHRWHIPLTMADAFDAMHDPVGNKYVAYGKMWVHGPVGELSWKHAMGRIESTDFIHWSEPELLLTTDDKDADNIKFHTSPVFHYEGLYLSLNQIYTDPAYVGPAEMNAETTDIELMSSRDGRAWNRFRKEDYDGVRILPRGALDPALAPPACYLEFDSAHIFTNSTPIVLDDEIRFYYGAYGSKSGVGLATVKRDRIVGLKARETFVTGGVAYLAGQITLRPRDLTSVNAIAINGAVESGGHIKVELLNRDGRPLPGYTVGDAIALTGDAAAPYSTSVPGDPLNRKVSWNGSTGLAALSAADRAECIIRIHLQNAEIFSCSLVP